MLISQRIAKDPTWLRTAHVTKSSKQAVFDLRMKIVRAVKMVVPQELLDGDRDIVGLNKQIFGTATPTEEETQRRLMLYSRFSKTPYPLLFVENHRGAVLIEEQPDGTYDIHSIVDTGRCLFFSTNVRLVDDGMDANTRWMVPLQEIANSMTTEQFEHYRTAVLDRNAAAVTILEVVELLLYVNTKNVVKHHYQPTKRENAPVPKPLLPHYSYYVLDVFKDRKQYVSLEQITEDLCNPNKPPQERRAGLVMGHFKKRATGLFWWNTYIRNARNQASHGYVDKDYRVVPA